jgi:hypothetical protein
MIKRYALFLCLVILALMLTGCPAGTSPTDPTSAAPTLSGVRTSASQIPRGQLLIFYVTYVDLTGDLNGGPAVVTDDENNDYGQLYVSNAEGTSGELTITIRVNNLLTPNKDHSFVIVVFDRAGNISNSIPAVVYILP